MNCKVLDTNVLLIASAAEPYSPFDDSHLPRQEQEKVFNWLVDFRRCVECTIALDAELRIFEEYNRKLTIQDYGLQVIHEKMQTAELITIDFDENGHAIVPVQFDRFDRSDRKMLAVCLSNPSQIGLVNASDTDWLEIENELIDAKVSILHIIEDWLRATLRPK